MATPKKKSPRTDAAEGTEQQYLDAVIAERDREWGIALAEIDIAVLARSTRHGKIRVTKDAEDVPAKRIDPDKQWRAQVVLTNVLDRVQNPEAGLRELMAIFGYEVEA